MPEKPKEPICSLRSALWLLLTLKVKVDISQNLHASGIRSPGQHQSLSYFPLLNIKSYIIHKNQSRKTGALRS